MAIGIPGNRSARARPLTLTALPTLWAVLLLITLCVLIGAVIMVYQSVHLGLWLWVAAAALGMLRALVEQARQTCTLHEEMTRELRLLRQIMTVQGLEAVNGGGQSAAPRSEQTAPVEAGVR